jgi:hypothetical protein
VKEIPELKMAMISVLFASFEVNQIIDKNRNIGNKELAKINSKMIIVDGNIPQRNFIFNHLIYLL